jgi:hypothetical protein
MKQLGWSILILFTILACHRRTLKPMVCIPSDQADQELLKDPDPLPRFVCVIQASDTDKTLLDTLLYFNRTACFGFCPTFEFTIFSNGTVLYHGIQHVQPLGQHWFLISENEWDQLLKLARKTGFFDMENVYPVDKREFLVDLPNINLMIQSDGRKKFVLDNHSAPEKLKELEREVEETLKRLLTRTKN